MVSGRKKKRCDSLKCSNVARVERSCARKTEIEERGRGAMLIEWIRAIPCLSVITYNYVRWAIFTFGQIIHAFHSWKQKYEMSCKMRTPRFSQIKSFAICFNYNSRERVDIVCDASDTAVVELVVMRHDAHPAGFILRFLLYVATRFACANHTISDTHNKKLLNHQSPHVALRINVHQHIQAAVFLIK